MFISVANTLKIYKVGKTWDQMCIHKYKQDDLRTLFKEEKRREEKKNLPMPVI